MKAAGTLQWVGTIDLPEHVGSGGFDHAAVHARAGRLYVAHTANDALDIIDVRERRFVGSIHGLPGVAGALVVEDQDLIFTSNRGEHTVGIFDTPGHEREVARVAVGHRPNGLAYDPAGRFLLVANVGDPNANAPASISLVSRDESREIARLATPGRTRWSVFDPVRHVFFVNIMEPSLVVVVDPRTPDRLVDSYPVPAAGAHGLDLDVEGRRLYCACDAARLFCLDADRGSVLASCALSGGPDVVFFNAKRDRLYVAIGDPGVIDVLDTTPLERIDTVPTEPGAHTIGFDVERETVYAFLPRSHQAAVLRDRERS